MSVDKKLTLRLLILIICHLGCVWSTDTTHWRYQDGARNNSLVNRYLDDSLSTENFDAPTGSEVEAPAEVVQDSDSTQCSTDITCDETAVYRTIDGSCNNLLNPSWGQVGRPFIRLLPPEYNKNSRGIIRRVGRRGKRLPSTRKISTTIHRLSKEKHKSSKLTTMHMLWGQFIDHDITLTPKVEQRKCCGKANKRHKDCIPIPIPRNDPYWGPRRKTCMEMRRSMAFKPRRCTGGFREQFNAITAFLDAGAVYGSTNEKAAQLRTFSGGKLIVSADGLPYEKPGSKCNIPASSTDKRCFAAGDVRVNVWSSLISIHELFVREHNRIATILHPQVIKKYSKLSKAEQDEKTYQETRRIIGALIQVITYKEYLPNVLGSEQMKKYKLDLEDNDNPHEYDPTANPTVSNVFATAAFRFGHAEIPFGTTPRGSDYTSKIGDFLPFTSMFNRPTTFKLNGGYLPFIQSVAVEPTLEISGNGRFSAAVRDETFAPSFNGSGFDLPAVNNQRGRDHGIPPYNKWRAFCNLTEVTFNNMPDHKKRIAKRLKRLYKHPDDIDLYPAAIAEIPLPDAHVGPTFACLIGTQFQKLKEGDRFWFENQDTDSNPYPFTDDQIEQLSNMRLSKLLCMHANSADVPEDVFGVGSSFVGCDCLQGLALDDWL